MSYRQYMNHNASLASNSQPRSPAGQQPSTPFASSQGGSNFGGGFGQSTATDPHSVAVGSPSRGQSPPVANNYNANGSGSSGTYTAGRPTTLAYASQSPDRTAGPRTASPASTYQPTTAGTPSQSPSRHYQEVAQTPTNGTNNGPATPTSSAAAYNNNNKNSGVSLSRSVAGAGTASPSSQYNNNNNSVGRGTSTGSPARANEPDFHSEQEMQQFDQYGRPISPAHSPATVQQYQQYYTQQQQQPHYDRPPTPQPPSTPTSSQQAYASYSQPPTPGAYGANRSAQQQAVTYRSGGSTSYAQQKQMDQQLRNDEKAYAQTRMLETTGTFGNNRAGPNGNGSNANNTDPLTRRPLDSSTYWTGGCCYNLASYFCSSPTLILTDKGIEDLVDEIIMEARRASREVDQLLVLPSAAEVQAEEQNALAMNGGVKPILSGKYFRFLTSTCCFCDTWTFPQLVMLVITLINVGLEAFALAFSGSDMVNYMVIVRSVAISLGLFITLICVYWIFRLRGGDQTDVADDGKASSGINRNGQSYSKATAAGSVSPAMIHFLLLLTATLFDCSMMQLSHNSNDVIKIGVVALTFRLCNIIVSIIDAFARSRECLYRNPSLLYAAVRTLTPGSDSIDRIRAQVIDDYRRKYFDTPLPYNQAREMIIRRLRTRVEEYNSDIGNIHNSIKGAATDYTKYTRGAAGQMRYGYPTGDVGSPYGNSAAASNNGYGYGSGSGAYGPRIGPDGYALARRGYTANRGTTIDALSLDPSLNGMGGGVGGFANARSKIRVDQTLPDRFRRAVNGQSHQFISVLLALMGFIFVCCAGNVVYELWRVLGSQPPIFWKEQMDEHLDRAFIRKTSFPTRENTGLKVHLVVVNGLREDYTLPGNSALGQFFDDPAIKADTLKFSARSQLPSFSIPNWVTILTGATPEDTGVTGDLQLVNAKTDFDNIYSIAKAYGVHSGMTGNKIWHEVVGHAVPLLDGDATIDPDEKPEEAPHYDWRSADLADGMRGTAAVQAAKRSTIANPFAAVDPAAASTLYELFVTQFSDVDLQAHTYGVAKEFNELNTYQAAIYNKTMLIRDIAAAIDSNTVLIVTSDHGHVRRGGHGGEDDVLRDIPIFFYKKGSNAAATVAPARNFLPDEVPRSKYKDKYSNLDLAATITALLGLPSPRQSLGIFIEEALEAFLPSNSTMRLRFYHDLLFAKINLVRQYENLLLNTFFSYFLPEVLTQRGVVALQTEAAVFDNPNGMAQVPSERQYADNIRRVIDDYWSLRNTRYVITIIRNFVLSFVFFIPIVGGIWFLFCRNPFIRLGALTDSRHPAQSMNWAAFILAFLVFIFYFAFTLCSYFVIYYGMIKQKQWDITILHADSVIFHYALAAMILPIVWFTLITKLVLWRFIRWSCVDPMGVVSARVCGRFFWFWMHLPKDLMTLLFVTWRYKANNYHQVLLFTHYLALITILFSCLLLFFCFPFAFFIPVVLSVEHVNPILISYRFRIITLMVMFMPMQVGAMLMVLVRPRCPSTSGSGMRMIGMGRKKNSNGDMGRAGAGSGVGSRNTLLWDQVWEVCRLQSDDYELEKVRSKTSHKITQDVAFGGGKKSKQVHALLVSRATLKVILAMLSRDREREAIVLADAEMALTVTNNTDQINNFRACLGLPSYETEYPTQYARVAEEDDDEAVDAAGDVFQLPDNKKQDFEYVYKDSSASLSRPTEVYQRNVKAVQNPSAATASSSPPKQKQQPQQRYADVGGVQYDNAPYANDPYADEEAENARNAAMATEMERQYEMKKKNKPSSTASKLKASNSNNYGDDDDDENYYNPNPYKNNNAPKQSESTSNRGTSNSAPQQQQQTAPKGVLYADEEEEMARVRQEQAAAEALRAAKRSRRKSEPAGGPTDRLTLQTLKAELEQSRIPMRVEEDEKDLDDVYGYGSTASAARRQSLRKSKSFNNPNLVPNPTHRLSMVVPRDEDDLANVYRQSVSLSNSSSNNNGASQAQSIYDNIDVDALREDAIRRQRESVIRGDNFGNRSSVGTSSDFGGGNANVMITPEVQDAMAAAAEEAEDRKKTKRSFNFFGLGKKKSKN